MLALQHQVSLRRQAMLAGLFDHASVSKQALFQRMGHAAITFLQEVLAMVLALKFRERSRCLSAPFGRVLIQDSTCVALPPTLRHLFPGPSNGRGESATLRIQCLYELLGEKFVGFSLSPFTRNDQAASADPLPILQPNDLLLRDLGYFSLQSFHAIEAAGAFFLSRLRYGMHLCCPKTGQTLRLRRLLRPSQTLDIEILLGREHPIRLRLLAFPLPETLANARRRRARADRDRRANHSPDYMALLGWHLFITNAPAQRLALSKATEIYRLRWRIETLFKTWKSHLGLSHLQRLGSRQLLPLVFGLLISTVLLHHAILPTASNPNSLPTVAPFSLIRLAQAFSFCFPLLLFAQIPLKTLHSRLLQQLHAHCRYEKRPRLNYESLKSHALA